MIKNSCNIVRVACKSFSVVNVCFCHRSSNSTDSIKTVLMSTYNQEVWIYCKEECFAQADTQGLFKFLFPTAASTTRVSQIWAVFKQALQIV